MLIFIGMADLVALCLAQILKMFEIEVRLNECRCVP